MIPVHKIQPNVILFCGYKRTCFTPTLRHTDTHHQLSELMKQQQQQKYQLSRVQNHRTPDTSFIKCGHIIPEITGTQHTPYRTGRPTNPSRSARCDWCGLSNHPQKVPNVNHPRKSATDRLAVICGAHTHTHIYREVAIVNHYPFPRQIHREKKCGRYFGAAVRFLPQRTVGWRFRNRPIGGILAPGSWYRLKAIARPRSAYTNPLHLVVSLLVSPVLPACSPAVPAAIVQCQSLSQREHLSKTLTTTHPNRAYAKNQEMRKHNLITLLPREFTKRIAKE